MLNQNGMQHFHLGQLLDMPAVAREDRHYFGNYQVRNILPIIAFDMQSQSLADDDSASSNSMNSEVPEEEVQVFAGQKGVRLDEFSLFHHNRLEMKFFTREVPSHGLYDYENEANAPLTSTHIVSKATKIYKKDNHLVLVEPHERLDADHQELFTILKQRNRFFVEGVEGDPKVDVDKFYDDGGKPTQPPQ